MGNKEVRVTYSKEGNVLLEKGGLIVQGFLIELLSTWFDHLVMISEFS